MTPAQVTDRLTVRQLAWADAYDLLALDGDLRVMRFLDHQTKSRAQIQAEVLPRLLASLGYRLRASAWGRGYATEGARHWSGGPSPA